MPDFIPIIENSLLRSHRQQNHHPAHIVAAISWHAYPYIVQFSRCLKFDRHSSSIAQEEQNKMLMILSIFLYHLYFFADLIAVTFTDFTNFEVGNVHSIKA